MRDGASAAADRRVWSQGPERPSEDTVRLLVIDNYDSFTYNLVQVMAPLDVRVDVVRNDVLTVDEALEWPADAVILSPGPGRPEDAGICVELIERGAARPLLGVCLGHQALGLAYGAPTLAAPTLMHGKTSDVRYAAEPAHPMFAELPNPFEATRYHSLCVAAADLPDELVPLAHSEDDDVLMAMAHRDLPYWGVQFHPESVLTTVGPRLLANFVAFAAAERARRSGGPDRSLRSAAERRAGGAA